MSNDIPFAIPIHAQSDLDEIDALKAKVERLEARGIEDMKHEIKEGRELLKRWQPLAHSFVRNKHWVENGGAVLTDDTDAFLAEHTTQERIDG